MTSGKVFVVIGAKGGTGAEIVKRLSEKSADEVSEIRCVVRSPASIPAGLLPTGDKRVKVYAGDATNHASLVKTFSSAEAVFFAAQGKGYRGICKVDRDSMQILGKAALEKGVKRVVLISTMLSDPKNKYQPTRLLLNSPFITGRAGWFRKGMMDLKFEGENILRKTGQPYTIVRPGHLYDGPLAQWKIVAGQTNGMFAGGKKSTRADIAAFCVMVATSANAENATIEVASDHNQKGSRTVSPEILRNVVADK